MRIHQLVTLSMIGIAAISAMATDGLPRREVQKGKFGSMEVVDWHDTGMQKTVYLP